MLYSSAPLFSKLFELFLGYFDSIHTMVPTESDFQGELTDVAAKTKSLLTSEVFSKLNKVCFGYFDPQNVFLNNKK